MRAQFASLGVDTSAIPATDDEEEVIEVWEPNWPALRAFLACETQWRAVATMAGLVWIGLDYSAVEVAMRRHHLDCDFGDLQALEAEALTILNGGTA
ncbi:MAG: DUF1799 domain-containing protein [Rhizobiales bacterium]|nr:DUF1799 domain-containing protein [Hyphomicrobiales bacterium]